MTKIVAIYEPKGLASEYSPLACNLYSGCSHSCSYCYCPAVLHRTKEDFFVSGAPRSGILDALVRDAQKLVGDLRPVLLCFTSDPYQPVEERLCVTQKAIGILAHNRLRIRVLTKNPLLAVKRDLQLLLETKTQLGTTLTCLSDSMCEQWEKGAPPSRFRIDAMTLAKQSGVTTWVSFEPVIRPGDTLAMLQRAHEFADVVKIGKWNYDAGASGINWVAFVEAALRIVKASGLRYYFKNELWALSGRPAGEQTNLSEGETDRTSAQRWH